MNNSSKKFKHPPDSPAFADYDAGLEYLEQTVSLLRTWATAPQMFDNINLADRQNILLIALKLAESAQIRFSPRK